MLYSVLIYMYMSALDNVSATHPAIEKSRIPHELIKRYCY